MVFQHYALFPHLDVAANIAYGLRQRAPRPDAAEIGAAVEATLEMVRLPGYGAPPDLGAVRRPAAARGAGACPGQPADRAAARRAAGGARPQAAARHADRAAEPAARGRHHLRPGHPRPGGGAVDERHVCVMRGGRIVQQGSPTELYDAPASAWVADFVGKIQFPDRQGRGAGRRQRRASRLANGVRRAAPPAGHATRRAARAVASGRRPIRLGAPAPVAGDRRTRAQPHLPRRARPNIRSRHRGIGISWRWCRPARPAGSELRSPATRSASASRRQRPRLLWPAKPRGNRGKQTRRNPTGTAADQRPKLRRRAAAATSAARSPAAISWV